MTSFSISDEQFGDRYLEDLDIGEILEGGALDGTVHMSDYALLRVYGTLSSSSNGVLLSDEADDTQITVFGNGVIAGAQIGISSVHPVGVEISNSGTIEGDSIGVSLAYKTGEWRFDNFGDIEGGTTGIAFAPSETGASVSLYNEGNISGDWGLTCQTTLVLDNFGTVEAAKGVDGIAWAVVTFGYDDILTNSGTILGRVDLEHGNNYFSGISGVQEWVQTGNGTDTIFGGEQAEMLSSLNGKDTISGGGGNDKISGGRGNDILSGDAGKDKIIGEAGSDSMIGGGGKDTFVFKSGHGKDYITDFAAAGREHDILDLRSIPAIKNFSDLTSNHMRQVGSDLLISTQSGDSILLLDVRKGSIDAVDVLI